MNLVTALLCLLPLLLNGQGQASGFFKLGASEKWWVMTHPFKAGKAFRAMQDTRKCVDSLYTLGVPDKWIHGGLLDAYRHTYWMALTGYNIGIKAARKLGKAHERSNYRDFLKGKTEDGFLTDATASEMDLHNNEAGLSLVAAYRDGQITSWHEGIMALMDKGLLLMLKLDEQGRLLDCEGRVILQATHTKKDWKLPVCLLPTRSAYPQKPNNSSQ